MTLMGLNYLNHQETKRSNLAREAETERSNRARETETARSNRANEAETHRSNVARETETNRHNLVTEGLELDKLTETRRHNVVTEDVSVLNSLPMGVKDVASSIYAVDRFASGKMDSTLSKGTQQLINNISGYLKGREPEVHDPLTLDELLVEQPELVAGNAVYTDDPKLIVIDMEQFNRDFGRIYPDATHQQMMDVYKIRYPAMAQSFEEWKTNPIAYSKWYAQELAKVQNFSNNRK